MKISTIAFLLLVLLLGSVIRGQETVATATLETATSDVTETDNAATESTTNVASSSSTSSSSETVATETVTDENESSASSIPVDTDELSSTSSSESMASTEDDSAHATDPDFLQETDATKEASSSESSSTQPESSPSSTQQESSSSSSSPSSSNEEEPVQSGPLIDIFGTKLYSLEMMDEKRGRLKEHYTNEILAGKKVIGLYFSADWCGPCRQFTPELVQFYKRMNSRRGKKDQFQIVWISRCRDVNSYGNYFAQMPWIALPPEEALGARGQMLGDKYKVKSIPTLVLIDDLGQTITTDARNKIPQDKAGVGFPWRNPISQVLVTVVPRSLRLMIKSQVDSAKTMLFQRVKNLVRFGKKPVSA